MLKKLAYFVTRHLLEALILGVMGVKVEGRENLPAEGAFIVAPNHKSNWDPPVIGVAVYNRVIHYMAKEELFKNPFFGALLRFYGTFPVRRGVVDRAALRKAVRVLKDGHALGIFPEGTRIHGEGLGKFHSGMASIALMTGVPIVPVAVVGTAALPKGRGAAVLIGRAIPVKKQRMTDEKVEEINDTVRHAMEQMIKDYKNLHENL